MSDTPRTDSVRAELRHVDRSEGFEALADELEQENAALRKDADRYRWLRQNNPIYGGSPFIARNFGKSFSQWTNEMADAAIDEAMEKKEQK
jgi:hypothetical protein